MSNMMECIVTIYSKMWAQPVSLQTGKVVTTASASSGLGKFLLKIEKRTIDYVEYVEADYLLIASGSSPQVVMKSGLFLFACRWIMFLDQLFLFFLKGYRLVAQLNHSIVDPVPSLFTFKIEDPQLAELAGVMFIIVFLFFTTSQ